MPQPLVGVKISPQFSEHVDGDFLRQVAAKALEGEGLATPVELGIVVTGDEEVRELNRQYRGLDSTTDVLAFALTEAGPQDSPDFVVPPDGLLHLGEVIISYPQALRQAQERGQEPSRELALLLVHGLLHLLGYDHGDSAAEEEMRGRERTALGAIFGEAAGADAPATR